MEITSPSLNKVTRPRLAKVFPRERLFSLLDGAFNRPAVWLSGPGGAGKSTLVASYLDSRDLPCMWYQVDEGDADIATLFYYLSLAVAQAVPDQPPPPLFTPEYQTSYATFAHRYFESTFSRLKTPCVLVLDDYHEVEPASSFHEIIKYAVSEVPPGVHIVIMSRQSPPAAMARHCANKQISLLGWEDLRLTFEETEAIVQLHAKEYEWKCSVQQLHDKVHGWMAGLVLFLERGNVEEISQWQDGRGTPEEVFNYFANELFNKASGEVQDFLLKTALLPVLVPSLAAELTGNNDAPLILAHLHEINFFLEKRHDKGIVYRLHPLFRDYLLNRCKSAFDPGYLAELVRTATRLLEQSCRAEDAAALCIYAEDWQGLCGIIQGSAAALIGQGRNRTVSEWLEHLPRPLLEQCPDLLYWTGACWMTSNFAQARGYFEKAYRLFENRREPRGLYLSWSGIVDSLINEWANFSRLDVWLDSLRSLMLQHPEFPSVEIEGKVANSAFSALMFHMPQHPEIAYWSERVLELVRTNSDPTYRIMTGNQLALYHLLWTGNHTKLAMVMDLLQPPDGGTALPPLPRVIWVTLKGFQEWASGLSEEAQRTFAVSLGIANESGVHVWDTMLYFQGIVSYLGEGDYQTAGRYLDELAGRIDRSQHLNFAHYSYIAAWQAVLAGDIGHARELLQKALEIVENLGGPFTQAVLWAAWTQVQYRSGMRDEAVVSLEKALFMAREIKSALLTYRNLVVKADFALDAGDEAACLQALREAFSLGREQGYMNVSWWQRSIMTRLCMKALETGIEVEYVRKLIARRNLVPMKPPTHLEQWPWIFKVYTLGRFELVKSDRVVEFCGKVQKKPLEMLKALVALGGEEAHEGQLADLLWPESDGDTARNSIKVTLHRLRELVGSDGAILVREGRLALDRNLFWTDAWAFEQLVAEAHASRSAGRESEALQLSQKALGLYRGRFLTEDAEKPWALSPGKRLHSAFLHDVIATGSFFEAKSNLLEAIVCFGQGLAVDDLAEELYQHLMGCYLAAGLRAEAITTFERCKKTLAISLAISPSAKTRNIMEHALDGSPQ